MSDLDPAIWLPVPVAPMPILAELREAVLIRSTKRMPKWKFRAAKDIVMQIQPRQATITKANKGGLPWFDCLAVIHDEVSGVMLSDPPRDSWKIKFRVTNRSAEEWWFKIWSVGYRDGWQSDEPMGIHNRLCDLMPKAFARLRPEMMLQPACLMCGRGLTDPVSMARWVGPECAGTSSVIIPYTASLSETTDDLTVDTEDAA